eukprot:229524-Prorocentrum_minimum.AAC.2
MLWAGDSRVLSGEFAASRGGLAGLSGEFAHFEGRIGAGAGRDGEVRPDAEPAGKGDPQLPALQHGPAGQVHGQGGGGARRPQQRARGAQRARRPAGESPIAKRARRRCHPQTSVPSVEQYTCGEPEKVARHLPTMVDLRVVRLARAADLCVCWTRGDVSKLRLVIARCALTRRARPQRVRLFGISIG